MALFNLIFAILIILSTVWLSNAEEDPDKYSSKATEVWIFILEYPETKTIFNEIKISVKNSFVFLKVLICMDFVHRIGFGEKIWKKYIALVV